MIFAVSTTVKGFYNRLYKCPGYLRTHTNPLKKTDNTREHWAKKGNRHYKEEESEMASKYIKTRSSLLHYQTPQKYWNEKNRQGWQGCGTTGIVIYWSRHLFALILSLVKIVW